MSTAADGLHFLIVGGGSVGKRHAQNLAGLGHRISCCDPRADRRDEVVEQIGGDVRTFPGIEDALAAGGYDGVVVGSPTSFHPAHTIQAVNAGLPVLLEKPVAVSLADALEMQRVAERTSAKVLLGYTWRWWEPLRQVRQLLAEGKIGPIRHVQFHLSAHLADWHPWEHYSDFFMAKQEQGGGALLDESHWIDLMVWLFGMPKSVYGRVEKISDLEISSDDNVDILAVFDSGTRASVHLDIYGRPHERFIRFVGENGTIFWSSDPNETRIVFDDGKQTELLTHDCERNDMFLAVAKEFVEVIGGGADPSCTIADGINVMKIVEAVRHSTADGCAVSFD